ncbi:hypothetical protein U1Q18_016046 [Sarracenia purpurea var. burkii]
MASRLLCLARLAYLVAELGLLGRRSFTEAIGLLGSVALIGSTELVAALCSALRLCSAPPNWWLLSARLYVSAQFHRTGGCSLLGYTALLVTVSSSQPSNPRLALSLGWCAPGHLVGHNWLPSSAGLRRSE